MRLCVYLLKPFDSNPPFLYPLGGRERMHLGTNGLSKNKSDFLAYLISMGLGENLACGKTFFKSRHKWRAKPSEIFSNLYIKKLMVIYKVPSFLRWAEGVF